MNGSGLAWKTGQIAPKSNKITQEQRKLGAIVAHSPIQKWSWSFRCQILFRPIGLATVRPDLPVSVV
jgi:hypothetical protein